MTTFIQNLKYNWHLMRVVRLGIGIIAAFQAYQLHEPILGMLAFFLIFQGVTNTGCAGGACAIPPKKEN